MDWSRNALQDGMNLASSLGVQNSVEIKRSHYKNYDSYLEDGYQPDFIEIVGLFDYLPSEDIVPLLKKAYTSLSEGGNLIFANIAPNHEQQFVHQIIRWRSMIYREPQEVVDFALQAGFSSENIKLIQEPTGIYNIVTAEK